MPVDQARLVDAVLDPHAEGLADLGDEPGRAVRLIEAEDGGRLAVHLDVAPADFDDGWRGLSPRGERGSGEGRSSPRKDSTTR